MDKFGCLSHFESISLMAKSSCEEKWLKPPIPYSRFTHRSEGRFIKTLPQVVVLLFHVDKSTILSVIYRAKFHPFNALSERTVPICIINKEARCILYNESAGLFIEFPSRFSVHDHQSLI